MLYYRGGIPFYVNGTNLDSVALPIATFSGSEETTTCQTEARMMRCQYPAFTSVSEVSEQNITLMMDGINIAFTTKQITVYPNPMFKNFDNLQKPYSEELVLEVNKIL